MTTARDSDGRDEEALDRAQEKAFDAMEAVDRRVRVALAREALAISPLCSDGYFVLAGEAKTIDEALAGYRRAVEVAGEVLGKAGFEEYAGEFWGFIETRPYMRARHALALTLWRAGERDDAVEHYRDMLRLNPNDNQGIRYLLLDALITLGREDEATRLLERFPGDIMAAWAWSEALLSFRREGDSASARDLLKRALQANHHVPDYLLGRRRIPRSSSNYVTMGGEDEAAAYAEGAGEAWNASKGAKAWLAAATASPARPNRRPSEDELDLDRIDDAVLALLLLGRHDGDRVWKTFDWDAMDRLHAKGLISKPASKAKSVVLTEAGEKEAERLFGLLFTKAPRQDPESARPRRRRRRGPPARAGG
jgi:tetratricopeptide (TPR) repeat protein